MALEFTCDAPAGALSIRFDMRGLEALLAAMQGAMEEGTFTIGGGRSPASVGAVTFTFVEPKDGRHAGKVPAPPLALEPAE